VKLSAFKTVGGGVDFCVSDNGEGILPDVMEHIFIPFFTTKKDGSGIGLSLSKQIAARHGVTLHAKSKVGRGSRFALHLP
jgi:signal transduction histidine kinase